MRFLLEGSVRRAGERVRVTARLIEAATGVRFWAERYDRTLEDIFAVQDDVVERLVGTLSGWDGALAKEWKKVVRRKPAESLGAWDCYLLAKDAQWSVDRGGKAENRRLLERGGCPRPSLRPRVGLACPGPLRRSPLRVERRPVPDAGAVP